MQYNNINIEKLSQIDVHNNYCVRLLTYGKLPLNTALVASCMEKQTYME